MPLTQSAPFSEEFRVQFSSTRRGARLARLLAVEQLRSWGLPFDAAAQVVAELASNAVQHGRTPGRDFRLVLRRPTPEVLRIEVTDTQGALLPATGRSLPACAESGRGLLLVEALADRWGVTSGPLPCKTVWAELAIPDDGEEAAAWIR
ncbi:ATP-binding protein [Streptomyces sp. NBC_01429]|uniref:ATP-binding protein n=1 Tax=Streptomyces sp. NBC_01429 TaxID=2903862 RepID=UPI002E2E2B2A|nr:ATP-binding protein [Streptomyces sp. NBC_01429]